MGASRKLDPELDIRHANDGRVRSGSSAGIHSFDEVPSEDGAGVSLTLSNAEVAGILPTTVLKSPAVRPEFREGDPAPLVMKGGAETPASCACAGHHGGCCQGKLVRKP